MSWTTIDEKKAIDFMASEKLRSNGRSPTINHRIKTVSGWISSAEKRDVWFKNFDYKDCKDHAQKTLEKLYVQRGY